MDRTPPFIQDRFALYPGLERLERHHALVKKECLELIESGRSLPPMEALGGGYTKGGVHAVQWTTFMLKSGRFIEENCRLAPETARLLREIPRVSNAFFSVLGPGQHIEPHFGYYKGFLRYHLGVIVPDDNADRKCWIRLSAYGRRGNKRDRRDIERGEKYYWREGEGVLFDDTYLHEAANESDSVRVVLFVDLVRPLPWPLDLAHRLLLWLAHRDAALRRIRREAALESKRARADSSDSR